MTAQHGLRQLIGAALGAGYALASAAAGTPVDESKFTGSYWAQVRPLANFDYSCRTGWHAFSFGTQGYFRYDGTISGNWWLDHGADVRVRTRDGEVLILFYDGGGTLMKRRSEVANGASVFGDELKLYRRCDVAAESVVR